MPYRKIVAVCSWLLHKVKQTEPVRRTNIGLHPATLGCYLAQSGHRSFHRRFLGNLGVAQLRVRDLSDRHFNVVIGDKLIKARAYPTQKRRVYETKLTDGRILKTSPEHRVLALQDDGHFDWREVGDLSPGDVLAGDVSQLEGGRDIEPFSFEPGHKQRCKPWSIERTDSDLWEVLGWLVGDGNYRIKPNGAVTARALSFFYNNEEKGICDRHRSILKRYGLPSAAYPRSNGIEIKFSHEGFGHWLDSIGFEPNVDDVPDSLYRAPMEHRCGFLRGLFSADGHLARQDQVYLGCTDPTILSAVQRLLWSMGIRSRWTSGWEEKDLGYGRKQYRKGKLYVYDKEPFFDLIGFIQPHKQPILGEYQGTRADVVGQPFARRCALRLHDEGYTTGTEARRIRGLIQDPPSWGVTRKWISDRMSESAPERDDLKWHHSTVEQVIDTGEDIEMYDVEVFDDFHGFVVDGLVVHNSELELLMSTITSLLWAWQYNQKFFSQGSAVKGILNFQGAIPERQLKGFRRHWYNMLSGVENSWRTPITNAEKLEWIDLQKSNSDMEFNAWMDFLIKVACSGYQMDPVEVNFKYGNTGQKGGLSEASNKEKITESKERGLRPLLRAIASQINRHIIWPMNENFMFEFVGLDSKTHDEVAELHGKQVKSTRMVDELRAEDDLPPLKDGMGQVILDPTWMQMYNNKQQMEQQAEMGIDPNAPPGAPGENGDEGEDEFDFESLLNDEGGEQDESKPEKDDNKPPPAVNRRAERTEAVKKSLVIDLEL